MLPSAVRPLRCHRPCDVDDVPDHAELLRDTQKVLLALDLERDVDRRVSVAAGPGIQAHDVDVPLREHAGDIV